MKNSFVKGLITGILVATLSCSAVVYATEGKKSVANTDRKASGLMYEYDKGKINKYDLNKSGKADVLDMVKFKQELLNPYGTFYTSEGDAVESGSYAGGVAYSPNEIWVNTNDSMEKVATSYTLKLTSVDYDFWSKTDFPVPSLVDYDTYNASVVLYVLEDYTVKEFKNAFSDCDWSSKIITNEKLTDDSNIKWVRFNFNCMEKDGYIGTYNESGEYVPYTAKLIEVIYG